MQANVHRIWAGLQFAAEARQRLYRKISKLLANGLPLLKAVDELWQRASENGSKPNEPLAVVLDDCRRMVQNGRMLSEALESWIPRTEAMIILSGEQAGRLESSLLDAANIALAGAKIRKVVVSGIAYPAVILVLILIYLYIFGSRVIPEFARMVDPATWKGAAKSLYIMSIVVQNWMLYVIGCLACGGVAIGVSMPRWCGRARALFDRFPPYSIYRLVAGSGFLMAFSALLTAGVTVEKSLLRLSDAASPWLRERLDDTLIGIKSGLNCGEALRNSGYGFPSKDIIDDLCVYAQFKEFPDALKALADEWMEVGVDTISTYMKAANSVAIAFLALVIGWLVAGFFGIQQEIASMSRAIH